MILVGIKYQPYLSDVNKNRKKKCERGGIRTHASGDIRA